MRNKDAFLVPIIIVLGKLISFVFDALLGSYYGVGKISDAFIMAHSIPTILFEGVVTALISCYIPVQRSIQYESPEKVDEYNSNMTNIAFLLSLIITVIYFVFHHQINRLYASGFDDASLLLLDSYSSILVWSIPFIGASSIFRAHLQVSLKRAISSVGQIVCYSALIVAILVLYPNDASLAWATLIGNILSFVIFLTVAYKTGYKYRPFISLKERYIKTVLLMIFPIFASTLASEISSIVDKFFASQYADGIITSLSYGYKLSFAVQGIVSSSLLVVVYPILADKAAQRDLTGVNHLIYQCIELVSWIVVPLVCGGIVLSEPIIRLLFSHGNFDSSNVNIIASIFSVYLLGVLPMCIKHIGDRTCFALKKTKYAMITTFITVGMNVILDYLMSKSFGYIGLVFATGISILIGSISVFVLIKKETNALSWMTILKSIVKPFISAAVMIVSVVIVGKMLTSGINYVVRLILCVVIGGTVYIAVSFAFFRQDIMSLIEQVIRPNR